jgi:hypothetical protein
MLIVIVAWTVGFYVPFAYYVAAQEYARGEVIAGWDALLLVAGVSCGSLLMNVVCDKSASYVGFELENQRQIFYNGTYAFTMFASMLIGLAVTAFIVYIEMSIDHVHDANGRLLSTLNSFQDVVESYPMQRALGNMLFAYAFPAAFLAPVLLDSRGLCCRLFVGHISRLITRSHPEIRGRMAEQALANASPLRMYRYAHLAFNMAIAAMVFFFASGYTLHMFSALAFCHILIFLHDHVLVLRVTPALRNYSGQEMDQCALGLLVLPTGLILGAGIFHGATLFAPDATFGGMISLVLFGVFAHCYFHLKLIMELVPKMGKTHIVPKESVPYQEVATKRASNWFSANPIHCLRSRLVYGHEPAARHLRAGKEHLMLPNKAIGMHFQYQQSMKLEEAEEAKKNGDGDAVY